jgi:hypothetical protein
MKLFNKIAVAGIGLAMAMGVGIGAVNNDSVKADAAAVTGEDTYSYTFTAKQWTANGTKTLGGVDWTIAGEGGYWGYDATKGQQFGSGSLPYNPLTLSTNDL